MTTLSHPGRPTIRDVAAAAGVSLKTVSRVLNGEGSVLPGTADKVQAAVARLGYQRNEAAANLRRLGQATSIIGLVIEDVANPFYSVLARAVEEVARERHCLLLVASSDENAEQESEVIRAFCARRVDGLVIVPAGADHSFLASEVAAGTAVVFVDRPGTNLRTDTVVTANREGVEQGVEHLLALRHRRIGYIGDSPTIFTATERYEGYRAAVARAGIAVDHDLVRLGAHDVDAAEAAAADLLGLLDPPTALFTGNNRLTIGALRAARRLDAPVTIVGFDDFELSDLLDPPPTVVAQDAAALGRTAAELLFRRIDGDRRPPQHVTLGTTLVVRARAEYSPTNHPATEGTAHAI